MENGGAKSGRALVVKTGQLLKWAGYAKGWRMRSFKLTAEGLLSYSRNARDAHAVRSFSMDAVSRMRMTETKKGTGIELYLGEVQFLMVAKDRQEAHRWMFALQMVKGKAVKTAADVADLQRQLEAIQELDETAVQSRAAASAVLAPTPAPMLSPTPAPMLSPTPAAILSPTPVSQTVKSNSQAPDLMTGAEIGGTAAMSVADVPLSPMALLSPTASSTTVAETQERESGKGERQSKDVSGELGRGSLQLLSPGDACGNREAERESLERNERAAKERERECEERAREQREREREERERAQERERETKREREREREERERAQEIARETEKEREKESGQGDEDPFEEEEVLSPIELMQRHKRQASNQTSEPTATVVMKSPPGTVHLLDTQWKSFQLRTMQLQALSRWANALLPPDHRFPSIETAFADGVNLCRLAASLTGKEVQGCNFAPAHTAFKHMNVNRAIMHLKECGYDLPGIPAHEIITGRLVTIVTLLWAIFSQAINTMGWAGKVGQKALLAWSNEQAAAFGVTVTNFRSSFQDGRAFYALLATRIPDHVNFAIFSTSQRAELLDGAFGAAEVELSVPRLLDGTVCEGSDLNPVAVMMYVYMLFNAVRSV